MTESYRPLGPMQIALDACVERGEIDSWECKAFETCDRYLLHRGDQQSSGGVERNIPEGFERVDHTDEFVQELICCLR